MATRPPPAAAGRGLGLRPRVVPVHPQFEDFKPLSEWKQDEESHSLLVNLPGFVKEHIKVSVEGTSKMVKIQGRRTLGGNKWSRFQENFTIPEDCKIKDIRAKFERGVLQVVMPKNVSITTTTTSQADHPSQDAKPPEAAAAATPPSAEPGPGPPRRKDAADQQKPLTATDDHIPTKAAAPAISEKQTGDEKSSLSGKLGGESKRPEHEVGKAVENEHEEGDDDESSSEGESSEDEEDHIAKKLQDRENAAATGAAGASSSRTGSRSIIEKYKKAVGSLASAKSEDRQLMVNMGVAVLVIVAFGAYLSYSFGSSAETQT